MPTPTVGDFYPQDVADNSGVATVEVTSSTSPNGAPEGTVHVTVDGGSVGPTPATAANTPAIVTSAGTALAANTSRKSWSIQNLDTDVLYVRLGGTASSSVFHFLLKGGLVADDGLGGIVTDDIWSGLVSVAGTTPRFVVSELS